MSCPPVRLPCALTDLVVGAGSRTPSARRIARSAVWWSRHSHRGALDPFEAIEPPAASVPRGTAILRRALPGTACVVVMPGRCPTSDMGEAMQATRIIRVVLAAGLLAGVGVAQN